MVGRSTRQCGFCGQDIDRETNDGHNIDCVRAGLDYSPSALAQPSTLVASERLSEAEQAIARWKGDIDVMGDELLDKLLHLIPMLESLAHADYGSSRSGPNIKIRAAKALIDESASIMKIVQAHRARECPVCKAQWSTAVEG
jgi:hypothetical protein